MLMSIQTGFNLVNAAVVCAVLESITGLEPSSDTTEARYLKPLSVYFDLLVMPLLLFVINLTFSVLIFMPEATETLSTHSTNFAGSSSSAKPSMSSVKRRLVIGLPPVLTVSS